MNIPFRFISIPQLIAILAFAFCCPSILKAQKLFDPGIVSAIKIEFENADWDKLLDSFKQNNSKNRLLANVTLDGQLYKGCKVRYKGNSSYFNIRNTGSPKLPFNIEAPVGNLFGGKYEIIKLSNNFRDPSQIREVLGYDVARQFMNAPQSGFVHLYVNNKDYGLYTSVEPVEKMQVEQWTGVKNGTLIKCDPDWNVTDANGCVLGDHASLMFLGEDSTCYSPFYELEMGKSLNPVIRLTRAIQKEPTKINTLLAIDETLWMLAFNQVLVNLDSYHGKLSHNYYLYCDSFGTCMPIIWDLNLCLGGFAFDGASPTALSTEKMISMSPFLHYDNAKRPLISVVLKDPLYRKMYLAHLRTMQADILSSTYFQNKTTAFSNTVESTVANDPIALYSLSDYKKNRSESVFLGKVEIPGLITLAQARGKFLAAHPAMQKTPPELQRPTHKVEGANLTVTCTATNATKAHVFVKRPHHLAWEQIPMQLTENVFSANFPHTSGLRYFVVAENEEAAACFPAKSSKEAVSVP